MKTRNGFLTAIALSTPKTDAQLLAEIDDTVRRASQGDRNAIGKVAILSSSMLLDEAASVLEGFEGEAADVVQDFLLSLLEGRSPFTPSQGRAVPWMRGVVRAMARKRRAERERDWGIDSGP